ncbi:DgyrCDS12453 [Dimorphilus gyrociliatus]|uniref:DgyrCDS12453 n=1 Tax=Dimorphilus gyrociliatus TaxID=2664684 RepID=A0A7I8W6J3_9ANNE|nr:DgyrCDS12453 [Dimorphilus gyrociliatus]
MCTSPALGNVTHGAKLNNAYKKVCQGKFVDPCFVEKKGLYLDGWNNKIIKKSNEEDCKKACLNAQFDCSSAEFSTNGRTCYISSHNSTTKSKYMKKLSFYIYWERKDLCRPDCHFIEKMGKKITSAILHSPAKSLYQCQTACMIKSNCSSLTFTKKDGCLLSDSTKLSSQSRISTWIKSCPSSNTDDCFEFFTKDKVRTASVTLRLTTDSIEKCKLLCLQYKCPALTFQTKRDKCLLMSKEFYYVRYGKRLTSPDEIRLNTRDKCKSGVKQVHNKYFPINGRKVIRPVYSPYSCLLKCLKEKSFKCSLIHFKLGNPVCTLSSEMINFSSSGIDSPKNEYIAINCDYNEYCFKRLDGKFLSGLNTRTILSSSEEKCKLACISERKFLCRSCDFYKPDKHCYLSTSTRQSNAAQYSSSANFIHFERLPACRFGCSFDSKILTHEVKYSRKLHGMTSFDCKAACIVTNDCHGIVLLNNGTCLLSSNSSGVVKKFPSPVATTKLNCKPAETDCFTMKVGVKVLDQPIKSYILQNETACRMACLDEIEFECRIVAFYRNSGTCNLYFTKNAELSKSFPSTVVFSKLTECQKGCGFRTIYKRALSDSSSFIKLKSNSLESCKSICLRKNRTDCIGIYYDRRRRICNLIKKTKKVLYSHYNSNYVYASLDCSHCFTKYDSHYSIGHKKVIKASNETECTNSCMKEITFYCRSADYDLISRTCALSIESQSTKPKFFIKRESYIHWDKTCNGVDWDSDPCFLSFNNMTVRSVASEVVKFSNPKDCKQRCMNSTKFVCSGATFSSKKLTCTLYNNTKPSLKKDTYIHTLNHYYYSLKQICKPALGVSCFMQEFSNRETVTHSKKSLKASTLRRCQMLCFAETDFICTAISFQENSRNCRLYETKEESILSSLLQATGSIFSIKRCVNKNDECFTTQEVHIWKDYSVYLSSNFWSCRALCIEDSKCRAFIFINSTCHLSGTIPIKKFGEDGLTGHIKNNCADLCTIKEISSLHTSSQDIQSIRAISKAECIKAFLQSNYSLVKSAEYNSDSRNCYLKRKDIYSASQTYKFSGSHAYFQRDCPHEHRCFRQQRGYHMKGSYIKAIYLDLIKECEEECHKDENCLSIDYNGSDNLCVLHSDSKATKPILFEPHNTTTYSEKTICDQIPGCFKVFMNSYVNLRFSKIVKAVTAESCKKYCLSTKYFYCRSAIYRAKDNKCIISAQGDIRTRLRKRPGSVYLHRTLCKDCEMVKHVNKTIPKELYPGNRYQYCPSFEECSKICFYQFQPECRSALYNKRRRTCRLLSNSNGTWSSKLISDPNYIYFEKKCKGLSVCKITELGPKTLLGPTKSDWIKYKGTSKLTCQILCDTEKSFVCTGAKFDIQSGDCFLYKNPINTPNYEFKSSTTSLFFIRNCDGKTIVPPKTVKCPPHWHYVHETKSCYHLKHNIAYNYETASSYCYANGGNLISYKDEEEFNSLTSTLERLRLNHGINSEVLWWTSGQLTEKGWNWQELDPLAYKKRIYPHPITLTKWFKKEPKDKANHMVMKYGSRKEHIIRWGSMAVTDKTLALALCKADPDQATEQCWKNTCLNNGVCVEKNLTSPKIPTIEYSGRGMDDDEEDAESTISLFHSKVTKLAQGYKCRCINSTGNNCELQSPTFNESLSALYKDFFISKVAMSFEKASLYCKSNSASMLILSTEMEEEYWTSVLERDNLQGVYWLSAKRRDNKWYWLASSKHLTASFEMTYTNWHENEPNNYMHSESAAVLWYTEKDGWKWADANERNLYPFVCVSMK